MPPCTRFELALAAALWISPPLLARDNPCLYRSVLATVVDRNGNMATGLTAANFRGNFRGQPVEILSATFDSHPRRVALLLDVSGSMTWRKEKWKEARLLAEDFVRNADSFESAVAVIYSSKVLETMGLPGNSLLLAKRLAVLPEEMEKSPRRLRRTALYDAILAAVDLLRSLRAGDAIYAVTDGEDNLSVDKASGTDRVLASLGLRMFAFLIELENEYTIESQSGRAQLRHTVEVTGGNLVTRVVLIPGMTASGDWPFQTEMPDASLMAHRLYQQMNRFYRLEIKLPLRAEKPRKWKLEAVDEKGSRLRDTTVLYPRQLLPCDASPHESKH